MFHILLLVEKIDLIKNIYIKNNNVDIIICEHHGSILLLISFVSGRFIVAIILPPIDSSVLRE